MPKFVGYARSDFDPERYRREVCDNHGQTLTTLAIRSGIAKIAAEYEAGPNDHWLSSLKSSSMYLSPTDGAE
jgi:hypothetical protein